MAFDGSLNDQFVKGRRLRPLLQTEAIRLLPKLIYRYKQDQLLWSIQESPDMPKIIFLKTKQSHESWTLLLSDFLLCQKIAGQISISQFFTEPPSDILNRIAAYVAVTFTK
jgi:hypothetical protein